MLKELITVIAAITREYKYWTVVKEETSLKDYPHTIKSKREWKAYCTGRITSYEYTLMLLSKLQGREEKDEER